MVLTSYLIMTTKWYTSDTPNADGKRNRLTWVPTSNLQVPPQKWPLKTCVTAPFLSASQPLRFFYHWRVWRWWWRRIYTAVANQGDETWHWKNQSPQTDGNAGVFPGNDQKYDQFKTYKGFLKVDITRFKVPKMDCTDTRVEAFWKEERGSRIGRGKDGGKWQ